MSSRTTTSAPTSGSALDPDGRAFSTLLAKVHRRHGRLAYGGCPDTRPTLEDVIEVIEKRHLKIYTVNAGNLDLTTSSGRMVARMLGVAARQEVEHMAERIARGHAKNAKEGRWKGGRRPFGYETDGMTIREAEAFALRTAAKMILAGESLNSVSEWVSGRVGRRVAPTTLRGVLIGPRVAGLRRLAE